MEEIRKTASLRLPALPRVKKTPLLTDAFAFAVIGGGGYLALRLMDLVFQLCGVG